MTMKIAHARRSALPAAALAVLLLAGCSSGHVGEDWQCPLAAGGSCASVAAADPAVPKTDAGRGMAREEPLRLLPRGAGPEIGNAPSADARSCVTGCGFDPFGWLIRLFDGERAGGEKTAAPGPVRLLPSADPASAALPAETDAPGISEAGETTPDGHDGLRTGEVVARIWIAPFVDAGGVYREASWVRVVLEPAGWRLR